MNEFLGDSVILVSRDSFYKLCHKYKLSIGYLEEFTGPEANLKELSGIKWIITADIQNYAHTIKIKRIHNFSDKSEFVNTLIIVLPNYLYRMSDIDEFKDKEWADRVSLDVQSQCL